MLNLRMLGFGSLLALNDIIVMPFVKQIVGGWPFAYIVFPMLMYALDPIIFFFALKSEGMALMNFVWNLISNVLITITGVVFFKEVVPPTKMIGVALSFIALFFMTYEGEDLFWGK